MSDVDMLREAAAHLRTLAAIPGNPNPYARPDLDAALADWLDAEADLHEARDRVVDAATGSGEWYVRLSASTLPQAVAVARIVLGGQP